MRIQEIISESLAQPYRYEMGMDNTLFHDSKGNSYYVRFDDFGDSVWSVAFKTGEKSTDEPTNRHDAFRVFATVISIIEKWAESEKPKVLIFGANRSSKSRISLYDRLSNKFTEDSQYVYLNDVSDISDMVLAHKIKSLSNSVPQERYKTYVIIHQDLVKPHNKLSEAPISNIRRPYGEEQPWGLVPLQTGENADYNGIRVLMRPSIFLQLAYPLSTGTINPEVEKHLSKDPEGEIASPYLNIKIPAAWFDEDKPDDDRFLRAASVSGHEGRNRMTAWMKKHDDEPVEIHLFFRDGLKRRDITDSMIRALNRGLHNQASQYPEEPPEAKKYIRGPLFKVIKS